MTITRAAIAAYLNTQFSNLGQAIGQSTDPLVGFAGDVDAALRKLGVARADLATATLEDSQEEAATTLAEYYAARRFWRQLGDRTNISLGGNSTNFTDQRMHVKAMMDDAQKRCSALGYDVTGDSWSVGWLNTDWTESELAL